MGAPQRLFTDNIEKIATNTMYSQQRMSVVFSGTTLDATQTELFLEGKDGMELIPPGDCVVLANWEGIGTSEVGASDPAHYVGRGWWCARRTADGNLTALGTNADPGAADGNPAGQAVFGTEGHCVFDFTGTKARLRVTGPAGTCYWQVRVELLCLAYPPAEMLGYGDS